MTDRVTVVVAGVAAVSVAWTVTVLAPAARPVVGTLRGPDVAGLGGGDEGTAAELGLDGADAVRRVDVRRDRDGAAERDVEAPTSGVRTKTDGPAAAVGASATPRNSVFAAAVASTVGADGENEAAEPFGSVSVTSWVGVVTARLTELPGHVRHDAEGAGDVDVTRRRSTWCRSSGTCRSCRRATEPSAM